MVKFTSLRESTAAATFIGLGVAGVWYACTRWLFYGTAEAVAPALGAIVIAGVMPSLIMKRTAKRQLFDARFSMSQRLDAFEKHACINIVDNNDRLTEVNEKLLELTGYKRDELIGRPVTDLYDSSINKLATEIKSSLRRGESWEGETPLRRKDAAIVYTQTTIMPLFDTAGDWAGSISIRTDVSRTNELIAERHTAQTLYELREDIWIIESETEILSYMNQTAETRFGFNDESYRGKSILELGCETAITGVLEACRALKTEGKTSARFEIELMGMPTDVSIKFLRGHKNAGRYLILITDISERLEQEQQKAAFVSTVSHELRSPLTSIKGAMGLLLAKSAGELPDKAVSLLEIAHRNADRLILIINDILDLDKITSGQIEAQIEDVDLAVLVREADQATAMLQQRFGVKVELIGTAQPVPFSTDPNRFIQVLTNLLSNAYKFSNPNSTIYVAVEDADDHVRVSVKDAGQGIPMDERHKIFGRFSDMANSDRALKGGTGLGLNICKAIVENLGGTIGFDTAEGVGSTFYFCLPKAVPQSAQIVKDMSKRSA